jgi:hypothetical protein
MQGGVRERPGEILSEAASVREIRTHLKKELKNEKAGDYRRGDYCGGDYWGFYTGPVQ